MSRKHIEHVNSAIVFALSTDFYPNKDYIFRHHFGPLIIPLDEEEKHIKANLPVLLPNDLIKRQGDNNDYEYQDTSDIWVDVSKKSAHRLNMLKCSLTQLSFFRSSFFKKSKYKLYTAFMCDIFNEI